MITENVKMALQNYKIITDSMESDPKVETLKYDISSLQGRMDDLQKELTKAQEPYQTKLNETEEYIKVQALEIATSFEHMGVKVSYRKGYERVTWVRKKMDDICLKNPALLDLLAPARKITPVDPSVSIAVLEVDKEPKESQ